MWKKTRHAQIQWEIFRILKRSYVNVPYFRPYFLGIFPGTPNSNGLISGYVNSLLLKMTVEIVDFPKWWFSIVFCMFTRGYHQSSDKAICILGGLWYTAFSDKTDKTHMVMGLWPLPKIAMMDLYSPSHGNLARHPYLVNVYITNWKTTIFNG